MHAELSTVAAVVSRVLTVELLRRGYPEAEIVKLWGGNFLRLLREVESVAAVTREI